MPVSIGLATASDRFRGLLRFLYPCVTAAEDQGIQEKQEEFWDRVEVTIGASLKMAFAGIGAGAIIGLIVAGGGSRIVMRILALANEHTTGLLTDNGNIVGEVTGGGTLVLIIRGAVMGAGGGLFYVLARRWLPAPFLPRAVVFAVLGFLITAAQTLDETNPDFLLFGPTSLAVALFAFLYFPYALGTAWLVNRFDRYIPPSMSSPAGTAIGGFLLLGLTAFGSYHTITSMNAIL